VPGVELVPWLPARHLLLGLRFVHAVRATAARRLSISALKRGRDHALSSLVPPILLAALHAHATQATVERRHLALARRLGLERAHL